jgi:hypothetical protein
VGESKPDFCDAAKVEERDIQRAKHTSIYSEMARCGYPIIDYSNDELDVSNDDTDADSTTNEDA